MSIAQFFRSFLTLPRLGLIAITAVSLILLSLQTAHDREVALRTVSLGLAASLVAVPIGALSAWICLGKGIVARTVLLANLGLLLVPMLIHVSSWDAAFGKLGWLTSTNGQVLVPLVSGWTAAVWIHGIAAAPQVAFILLIGLRLGSRVFEEQALLDTSSTGVFWSVTIARLWPLVALSVIWIVISAAREIAVTDLYQIGTLAEQVYLGYSLGLNSIAGNWTPEQLEAARTTGPGLTIALIGLFSLAGFYFFFKVANFEFDSSAITPSGSLQTSTLRKSIGIGLLVALAAVPMGNVIARACYFVRPIDGIPTGQYSILQMFRAIARSCADYQDEFIWSSLIATTSATLILVAAIMFAAGSRKSVFLKTLLAASLSVCCALPGPTIGTILAACFSSVDHEGIYWLYNYTIAAPALANFIFCWPLGALIIWFVFSKTPQNTIESANLEGAGSVTRFIHLTLLANPIAILGCWLVTIAICFGELSASHLVRPAGMDTVPRKMLGDLHAGVNELTAGITIVTTVAVVVTSLLGWSLIRLNSVAKGRK